MTPAGSLPADDLFVVEIDRFHGPMDLLLHLIRRQDIDILDIPIARITRQFLAAIDGLRALDLDSAGEFLEMAATLVRIKAQMLLPSSTADEDEDPRAELVRRLLEYEQIREVTQRLERAEADRSRRYRKGYLPVRPVPVLEDVPLETEWDEVFQCALGVTLPDPRKREHRVTPRTISMDEKAELILSALRGVGGLEFRKLLEPFREKMHGVMTFLAGLELTRRRRIRMRQAAPFHELWVYLREDEEEAAASGAEAVRDDAHEGASAGSAPGDLAPDGTAPGDLAPDGTAPEESAPEESAPDGTAPRGIAPDGTEEDRR